MTRQEAGRKTSCSRRDLFDQSSVWFPGVQDYLKQKKLCDYFVRLPLVEASESLSQEIKNYISQQNIY